MVDKKHFSNHNPLGYVLLSHKSEVNLGFNSIVANIFNILRPRQNGRHFLNGIFKYIFFNENIWI